MSLSFSKTVSRTQSLLEFFLSFHLLNSNMYYCCLTRLYTSHKSFLLIFFGGGGKGRQQEQSPRPHFHFFMTSEEFFHTFRSMQVGYTEDTTVTVIDFSCSICVNCIAHIYRNVAVFVFTTKRHNMHSMQCYNMFLAMVFLFSIGAVLMTRHQPILM